MPTLWDRDRELRAVDELLTAGGIVLVEGDAGIGKTRLVAAARDRAGGRRVLAARGAHLERDLAFGLVQELVGAAPPATGELFAALHGLYWTVADLAADTPVLILVDDAHWADLPSLRFLAYLAHRLDDESVALLVAARPIADDPAREAVFAALAGEPGARVLRPAPLGIGAVRGLVVAALGGGGRPDPHPAFVAACRASTGGNPFLLDELLAELRAAGVPPAPGEVDPVAALVPHEVERSVRTRLAALPPAAAALARATAVLGDGARTARAARLAGLPAEAAGPASDALVAARLLTPDPEPAFVHPLLGAAVAATMGPAERAAAHRTAAALLVAEGQPGDAVLPHLMAARPAGDEQVAAGLREAAGRASARGAPDVAARILRRALAEPPAPADRPGLLCELGVAELHAGEPTARDRLVEAVETATDPDTRGRATLPLARMLVMAAEFPAAVARCEAALAGLPAESDLAGELEAELVTAAAQDPRTAERARARVGVPDPSTRGGCMLLASRGLQEVMVQGSREEALRCAEQALTGGHLVAERIVARLPSVGITLTLGGRPDRAVALWDEVIARARDRGDLRGFALASAFRGYAAYHLGDLRSAVADTRQAVDLADQDPAQALTVGFASAWLAYALLDTEGAEGAAAALAGRSPAGLASSGGYLHNARGRLRLAEGRPAEAVDELRACGQGLAAAGARGGAVFRWRPPLALALAARGDRRDAVAVAAEGVRTARAWGAPVPLSEALRAAGVVAPDHLPTLEEAVEVGAGLPLEQAKSLLALGTALRRTGRRVEARDPLRRGLDLALGCGAAAVAHATQAELLAAGARPRRLRTSGADALTATERRVAEIAAEGHTNREIARALFVSAKTVETHLGHAYRKLGITARSQLAAALSASAGTGP